MKQKIKKLAIWIVAMAVSFSFLAMSIGSALNYKDIAETKLLVWGDASLKASILRNQTGAIFSIKFNMTVQVHNPGPKGVSLWLLVMKAWIRDYPTEDGVPTGGGNIDGQTVENNVTQLWMIVPAFSDNLEADIPAKATQNASKEFTLARTPNEALFRTIEDIASYAKWQRGLGDDQLDWAHYARITMYVSNVPRDVSGYGTYLSETPKITLSIGSDLSQPWGA